MAPVKTTRSAAKKSVTDEKNRLEKPPVKTTRSVAKKSVTDEKSRLEKPSGSAVSTDGEIASIISTPRPHRNVISKIGGDKPSDTEVAVEEIPWKLPPAKGRPRRKCPKCDLKTKSAEAYENHVRLCCGREFFEQQMASPQQDMPDSVGKDRPLLVCQKCGIVKKYPAAFEKHITYLCPVVQAENMKQAAKQQKVKEEAATSADEMGRNKRRSAISALKRFKGIAKHERRKSDEAEDPDTGDKADEEFAASSDDAADDSEEEITDDSLSTVEESEDVSKRGAYHHVKVNTVADPIAHEGKTKLAKEFQMNYSRHIPLLRTMSDCSAQHMRELDLQRRKVPDSCIDFASTAFDSVSERDFYAKGAQTGLVSSPMFALDDGEFCRMQPGASLSTAVEGQRVVYTGGRVLCCTWVPQNRTEDVLSGYILLYVQYTSCNREQAEMRVASSTGHVQLYNVNFDELTTDLHGAWEAPYGDVWSFAWCDCAKSGGVAGVLAMSCESGLVPVFCIPTSVFSQKQFGTLQPYIKCSGESVPSYCAAWSPFEDRSRLLAGYRNGILCLWDVFTPNDLLFDAASRELLPTCTVSLSAVPIRSVGWISAWKITALCADETCIVFDVQVRSVVARWIMYHCNCMRILPPPFSIYYCSSYRFRTYNLAPSSVTCKPLLQRSKHEGAQVFLGKHNALVWDIAFGRHTKTFICVDDSGTMTETKIMHSKQIKSRVLLNTTVEHACPQSGKMQDCAEAGCRVSCNTAMPVQRYGTAIEENLQAIPLGSLCCVDLLEAKTANFVCAAGSAGFIWVFKLRR